MTHHENHRHGSSVFQLKGFRGRLVVLIVVAGLLCISLMSGLFYAYVAESYALVLKNSTLPPELIAERLSELQNMALALGGLGLLVVVVVAVWAIYITHRVSGPIYHLGKVIQSIQAGKLDERLQLRAKDEFHDLARAFNQLMDQLQKRD